jgi:hypothetical protein
VIFQDLARVRLGERSSYILAAADALGVSELIIEKDFWVVWILERLFSLSAKVGPLTFKGGTSLSKAFKAINRFSEDIDISISRATLGFPDDAYFYDAGSGNETKRRVLEVREKAHTFTKETIRPALRAVIAAELGSEEGWTLESEEPRSLRFQYPTTQHGQVGYVKPDVSIEFGHADRWPAFDVDIQPYVVDVLDAVTGRVRVNVLDPQRTFWEKATLLHEIAHRDESIRFPPRHSRHYYDLALLAGSSIGGAAIANTALLSAVAAFKSVFFASGRARYDLAKPGTLRLMFPDFRRDAVAADYEQMQPMLFGSGMTFDDMCHRIIEVETRINGAT